MISTSTCLIVTGSCVDAEHARRLARRRAQPAGELREVVRRVQPVDRVPPVVAVDEVVPVGDQVAERAAVVAERDAAVHAAPGLRLQRLASGTARRPPSSRGGAPAPAGASASRAPTSGTRSSHPCARLHHPFAAVCCPRRGPSAPRRPAHHRRAPACSPSASPCGTGRPRSSQSPRIRVGDGRAGELAVPLDRRRAGTSTSSSSSASSVDHLVVDQRRRTSPSGSYT